MAILPENGKGPFSFRRWYEDDLSGFLVVETRVTRDFYGRLRDMRDVDKLDKNALEQYWVPPTEFVEDPLPE